MVAGAGKHFGTGGDVEWERWGLREPFYNRYPHNRLIRLLAEARDRAGARATASAATTTWRTSATSPIAADNAIFGQAGPRVSSPADGYFVPFLTKVVGHKKAREMWMLCRRYPALEALEMGLVNRVVPLDRLGGRGRRLVQRALSSRAPAASRS